MKFYFWCLFQVATKCLAIHFFSHGYLHKSYVILQDPKISYEHEFYLCADSHKVNIFAYLIYDTNAYKYTNFQFAIRHIPYKTLAFSFPLIILFLVPV